MSHLGETSVLDHVFKHARHVEFSSPLLTPLFRNFAGTDFGISDAHVPIHSSLQKVRCEERQYWWGHGTEAGRTGGGGIQRQGIHRHGSIPRPTALWRGLGPVSGPVCPGHSGRSPGGGGSAQRPVVPSLPLSLQGPGSGPGLPKNVFAGVGGPWSPFSTPTPSPREGSSSLFHVFHAYSMTKPLALSLSLCHSKRGGGAPPPVVSRSNTSLPPLRDTRVECYTAKASRRLQFNKVRSKSCSVTLP